MRASIASTLKVRAGLGPLLVLPEAVAERALAEFSAMAAGGGLDGVKNRRTFLMGCIRQRELG